MLQVHAYHAVESALKGLEIVQGAVPPERIPDLLERYEPEGDRTQGRVLPLVDAQVVHIDDVAALGVFLPGSLPVALDNPHVLFRVKVVLVYVESFKLTAGSFA